MSLSCLLITTLLLALDNTNANSSFLRSRYSNLKDSLEVPAPPQVHLATAPNAHNRYSQRSNTTESATTVDGHPSGPVLSEDVHMLAGSGDLEQLEKLIDAEPYWIMARDANGWTPLHEASRGGHVPVVDFLFERGADLNAQTYNGGTPLYEAEKYNGVDSPIAHYLLSLGALRQTAKARLRGSDKDFSRNKRLPHELAAQGRMDALNELVDLHGVEVLNTPDENGWTPLFEATRYEHLHVVRFLLDQGVDINARSKEGHTAFFFAITMLEEGSTVRQFLAQEGAEP